MLSILRGVLIVIISFLTYTGFAQCDVYISPGSIQVIDHNPGISFAFEIQNDDITPYSGGSLYMDWSLSGFISGPIWDFNLNPIIILPGESRFISTPVFDIPLPGNVPGNWDPYGGWTGTSYISFFKLALEANGECFQWVLNSDGTLWNGPLSDGCLNPNGDNFCDDACNVELIDFNLETEELTIIPYSTYCPNIINPAWFNQYPYDNPYIFGFALTFITDAGSINVNMGGQQIYESDSPLVLDLSNGILSIILEPILESINNGEYCELTLVLYNLNNTGQNINDVLPSQVIELINLCPVIEGCTDPEANNYNEIATIDNGGCTYDIYGCTDETANNFNPEANIDDESCLYDVLGCTDSSALNFEPLANIDDGNCEYDVFGCTDSFASNYNPLATMEDDSCEYVLYLEGCTDSLATNYNETAVIDNGDCIYDLCEAIWIPNVFTPNNDGINDVWEIVYEVNCWVNVEFNIFNRWGVKIYQGYGSSFDSYPFWDGSVNDGAYCVQDGVYYYSVVGRKADSPEVIRESGTLTVFR